MWHPNNPDTPKPEGRVMIMAPPYRQHFLAEWNGRYWDCGISIGFINDRACPRNLLM